MKISEYKLTANELVQQFQLKFPEHVKAMEECSHHYVCPESGKVYYNKYHLEGSIFAHSMLVLKLVEQDTPHDLSMLLVALLHDIGKPLAATPDHETKRTRFTGHESLSYIIAIDVINEWFPEMDQSDKDNILDTILMHGSLYRNPVPRINKMYIDKADLFARVYNFRKYDHFGRYSTERTDGGVSEISYSDVLKKEKKLYTNQHLVINSGLPCSGKTTNRKYYEELGYTIISRDDIMMTYTNDGETYSDVWGRLDESQHKSIDNQVRSDFDNAVRNGLNIVVDLTNCSNKSRKKWVNTCLKGINVHRDYYITCDFYRVGLKELLIRNKNRTENEGKHVPESVYIEMAKTIALPNNFLFDEINYIY